MSKQNNKGILDELVPEENKVLDKFYDINYTVSTLLLEYRLKHNMSQKQFAEMLGVSHYMIYRYENNNYNFSLMQLCEMCDKLDIEMKIEFTTKEGVQNVSKKM